MAAQGMISLCWETFHDFDALSLLFQRITYVIVFGWGAIFFARQALAPSHYLGVIPRWLILVTSLTMSIVVGVVVWLLFNCERTLASLGPLFRNAYGGAIIWSVLGMLAVIRLGTKSYRMAVDRAVEYRQKVEQKVEELTVPLIATKDDS